MFKISVLLFMFILETSYESRLLLMMCWRQTVNAYDLLQNAASNSTVLESVTLVASHFWNIPFCSRSPRTRVFPEGFLSTSTRMSDENYTTAPHHFSLRQGSDYGILWTTQNHIFKQVTLSLYAGIPALNYANRECKGCVVCLCVRARTRCFLFNF